jgi:two-component system chemotaxis response regulator CheY
MPGFKEILAQPLKSIAPFTDQGMDRRSELKILVVDDSKVMRSIVIRTLRQAGFGAHTMDEASDGVSALGLIESNRPDLVLTDWNMPGMPGIDLLRAMRAKGDQTPCVFVTSEGTPEMRDVALEAGASGIITKPFSPENFQNVLGDMLR